MSEPQGNDPIYSQLDEIDRRLQIIEDKLSVLDSSINVIRNATDVVEEEDIRRNAAMVKRMGVSIGKGQIASLDCSSIRS